MSRSQPTFKIIFLNQLQPATLYNDIVETSKHCRVGNLINCSRHWLSLFLFFFCCMQKCSLDFAWDVILQSYESFYVTHFAVIWSIWYGTFCSHIRHGVLLTSIHKYCRTIISTTALHLYTYSVCSTHHSYGYWINRKHMQSRLWSSSIVKW